jgi:hypothetical protein
VSIPVGNAVAVGSIPSTRVATPDHAHVAVGRPCVNVAIGGQITQPVLFSRHFRGDGSPVALLCIKQQFITLGLLVDKLSLNMY